MTQCKRIVSGLLIICLTLTILPGEVWAVMGDVMDDWESKTPTSSVENTEFPAPMLVEEPASGENPALSSVILEEEPSMYVETEETEASPHAAGDEPTVDDGSYITTNATNGISISTEKQSYMEDYGDKFRISITIGTDRPYMEGSHAYIGYLAVLEGYQWDQITSWWIDGGRVQYTFTLNSEDFAVNQQLHMVASVFPADNFATGASLCDHRFFLTINYTGNQIVLDNSMVELPQQELIYDGAAKEPKPIVTYHGTRLTKDTDYSVSYSNNINAGIGIVVVKGIEDYTGTVDKVFPIQKAEPTLSFTEASVTKAPDSGSFINPLTGVTDGTITYRSSNSAVASVDARNGQVTPQAEGSADIIADASEGTNYKAASASYALTVANGKTDSCIVSFAPNGGSISESNSRKTVVFGQAYGTLPVPESRRGFRFTGWYTAPVGGALVSASTNVTQRTDHTLYAHWEQASDGGEFRISAEDDSVISIIEKKPPVPVPPDPLHKTLIISTAGETTIQRDYEQTVTIDIRNPTDEPVWFYLMAENDGRYPDLSYETIQSGSKDSPMILAAGETVNVTLSVFAQNAERETYIIPLTAYVQNNGEYTEDSKSSITLTCALPVLNLSWSLVSSSTTSLSRTYRVQNNGGDLADLSIMASDELQDFVSFDPIIANYQLGHGSSVEFTVYPDLVKMKSGNVSKLTGQLIASCAGKTSAQECAFDTQGKEITVTTMGKLALKQDENPFSNFEIVEDTAFIQYHNGTAFVEVTDRPLNLADVLDNQMQVNIKFQSDLDLGIDKPAHTEIEMNSTVVMDEEADSIDLRPTVETDPENNSLKVTVRTLLTVSEYLSILEEAAQQGGNVSVYAEGFRTDPIEEGERFLLETTFTINDIGTVAGSGSDALGTLSDIYSVCSVIEDTSTTASNIYQNPNADWTTKVNYGATSFMKSTLAIGTVIIGHVNPIVGALFSLITIPLNMMLDDLQDQFLEEMLRSEYYAKMLGQQCTNRGSVSAKFYAPNYGRAQKPTMHTSGRMHGGGYVNSEDTNYIITMNGEPAGVTENSGLTDVHMEEIPADHLLPGRENEIVFDYDTSPGSHSVSTDTEITLLYPNDTEIAYIDQPDDLQDVRTKPDFCVYGENIYSDDNAIVGEPTKVHFNVYNRGSRGGWFTVTCTDDRGNVVHQEVNDYLAAFSGETFSVDWTPTKASSTFTVTLVNTSVNLEERSSSNNTASHVLTARNRQIPTVTSKHAGTIYENEPFSFIINVGQGQDIVGESFSVFGTGLTSYRNLQYENSGSGASRRYRVYSDSGLAAGDYSLNVLLSYLTSASTRGTKLETIDFSVEQRAWVIPSISAASSTTLQYGEQFTFSVHDIDNLLRTEIAVDTGTPTILTPEDSPSGTSRYYSADLSGYGTGEHTISIRAYYRDRGGAELCQEETVSVTLRSEDESFYIFTLSGAIAEKNPVFAVYRNRSYREEKVNMEHTGNTYRFLKTDAMMDHPSDYNLVVFCDSGVIIQNLASTGLVDTTDCHRAVMILDPGNELDNARITRFVSVSGEYFDLDREISWDAPLTLSPGTYSIALSGKVDGISVSPTIEVDVTGQNQVIDLGDYAVIYHLGIDAAGSDFYQVSLRMRDSSGDSWEPHSLTCSSEGNRRTLKCYTTSPYTLERMQESSQVYLLAYSNSEIYFIRIRDTLEEAQPMLTALEPKANDMVLDRSALNRVTLVTKSGDYSVSEINLRWDHLSVYLSDPSDNTIYLPHGEYTLDADFTDGTQTFSSTTTAVVAGNSEIVLDENLDAQYTDVVLSWANTYDELATVSCSNPTEHWYLTLENVTSGSAVKVLNGSCTFKITLTCNNQPVTFSRVLTLDHTDETPAITIGDHLSGTISAYFANEYEAEDTIRLSVNGIRDENGNILSTRYFNPALKGVATFTDRADTTRQFTSVFSASSMSGISVRLPGEAGEYNMAVALTFAPTPVSIDSLSGGSVTLRDPSNLLSEGAIVLAARYEGDRMVEVMSATLHKETTSVKFDRTLSSNWTLFFLDNRYMPLCKKLPLGT